MKQTNTMKLSFVIAVIFLALSAVAEVAVVILLQRAIDTVQTGNVNLFVRAIVFVLLLWVGSFLVEVLSNFFKIKYATSVYFKVRKNRITHLFHIFGLKTNKSDNELSFFTTESDIIVNDYYVERLTIMYNAIKFVLSLIVLISISWIVTMAVAVCMMLPIVSSALFSKRLQNAKKEFTDEMAAYIQTVEECVTGMPDIVGYDKEPVFAKMHDKKSLKVEKARFRSNFINALAGCCGANLGFLSFVMALALGGYFVITGDMTIGFMIAVIQLMNNLVNPINSIVYSLNLVNSAKLVVPKAHETKEQAKDTVTQETFNKSIEISNFGFCYDNDQWVVRNLNLSLKHGKKYAITAKSGFGKSTLAKAIAGMTSDYEGTISIDGVDISTISSVSYRKLVRLVRQNSYVFSGSVHENIKFFADDVNSGEIVSAAEEAMIAELLNDNQEIGNNTGLSGGEKQRVALARAILHKPQVLILDEVTAGIDINVAEDVINNLTKQDDLTLVLITHETNQRILSKFDEVIRLDKVSK